MALQVNQLYSETTRGALPRIQPHDGPGSVVVKQFKTGSGTLPVGCPIYIETASGFAVLSVPAGTVTNNVEQIHGIVWPDAVTLNGSGEVHGTVMMKGQIHVDDVLLAGGLGTMPTSGTTPTLAHWLLSLRSVHTAQRGLHIDGLTLAL
jgi:hypothetical protein